MDDQSTNINTQKSNNLEFTIGPGYAYNFVLKENFYTSVGASVSVGNIHTKLTTRSTNDNSITYQNNLLTQWQGKLGLGYNSKKFYSGLFATVSDTNYKQQHTTATNTETRVFYNLFLGLRIDSPKFLKRNVTKIEDKLSL